MPRWTTHLAFRLAALAVVACDPAAPAELDAELPDAGPPPLDPREITEPTPLLDADGHVAAHGWARGPLMEYDRAAVAPEHADRVREWEYYAVFTPTFALAITLTDLGILTLASVSVQDYATGVVHDEALLGGEGELSLPSSPAGDVRFTNANGFAETQLLGDVRHVRIGVGADGVWEGARADLAIVEAGESIAVVHRFAPEGLFFYENKRVALAVSGTVRVGERTWELPAEGAFAVVDWGRGAWPENVRWDWAAGAGLVDGRRVGLNLGTVNGDDSRGTADAVVVDGVLHALGRVAWAYDPEDLDAPWRFTSDDGRVELTLTPDFDESGGFDFGRRYAMTSQKRHGVFSGTVVLDDGSTLAIDGVRGAAEHVEIRW